MAREASNRRAPVKLPKPAMPFRARARRPTCDLRVNTFFPMLWALFVILVIFWALGLSLKIAGAFIHILLVVALVLLVIQLLTGRRAP